MATIYWVLKFSKSEVVYSIWIYLNNKFASTNIRIKKKKLKYKQTINQMPKKSIASLIFKKN